MTPEPDKPEIVSSRKLFDEYMEEVKKLKFIHPETGEEGSYKFSVAGGGYLRHFYATESGKIFHSPDNIDEIFKQVGVTPVPLGDKRNNIT